MRAFLETRRQSINQSGQLAQWGHDEQRRRKELDKKAPRRAELIEGDFWRTHDETDWEVRSMTIRNTPSVLWCSVLLGTTLGCSSPPAAPSAAGSAPAVGAPGAPSASQPVSPSRFGDRTPGVVYVTSQGLYYDTFVVKDSLPRHGRFQALMDVMTEFGPGQPG